MTVVTQAPARSGRWSEALLLLLAIAAGFGAFTLSYWGLGFEGFPDQLPRLLALTVGTALVAHLLIRKFAPYADPVLFPSALALNGIGLAMIYRIDVSQGASKVHGQFMLTFVGIALAVATVIVLRDHRLLRRFTWTSLVVGIILLLLPLVPGLGVYVYGARIWINVLGFSYQPAELAKIMLAIFFAGYLVAERDNLSLAGPKFLGIRLPKARHFVPILAAWAFCMAVLVLENDFGTALLFFGMFVAMLYVATERVSWLVIGGLLSLGGIVFVATQVPHIEARFHGWLHALDADVYDAQYGSYQLVQGLFGMASGGLFGTGLGQGYPTRAFAADSDFIFASIAEELGLVGAIAILCIYLVIVMRGLRIAVNIRDGFGKLLAAGLSITIALQCFVIIGGVTRLIPITGLALPFLAHGGSALLTNWIIIGLLLRMSNSVRAPAPAPVLPSPDSLDIPSAAVPTGEHSPEDSKVTEVVPQQ